MRFCEEPGGSKVKLRGEGIIALVLLLGLLHVYTMDSLYDVSMYVVRFFESHETRYNGKKSYVKPFTRVLAIATTQGGGVGR